MREQMFLVRRLRIPPRLLTGAIVVLIQLFGPRGFGSEPNTNAEGNAANQTDSTAVHRRSATQESQSGIVRRNSGTGTSPVPGTLDASFAPGFWQASSLSAITVQPDGKLLVAGRFVRVNGLLRKGIARLNSDGSLDTGFESDIGSTGRVESMAVQNDGKVLIGGPFSSVNGAQRRLVARLNADGSVDADFDPGSGRFGAISSIALQSDRKVVIGGSFFGVNRRNIARLHADGSLDIDFAPSFGTSSFISSILTQADGKILVGGSLYEADGTSRRGIVRLNDDGSIDTSFDSGSDIRSVDSIVLQGDGKVLVAGLVQAANEFPRDRVSRLNADGSLDTSFDAVSLLNVSLGQIAMQDDGKVLVPAAVKNAGESEPDRIIRLNSDGSVDASFDSVSTLPGGRFSPGINSILVQRDGSVLIGGLIRIVNNEERLGLARLGTDGALDLGFSPRFTEQASVSSIAAQADGKILASGSFLEVGTVPRNGIARLHSNGSPDESFDPGTGIAVSLSDRINSVALQVDGKVLIGGSFGAFNKTARTRLARLDVDGALDESFVPGSGPDSTVHSIVPHPDGKVLIGGAFSTVNEIRRSRLARLNADGSLDEGFDPGSGTGDLVYSIAIQDDDKVPIGGVFAPVDGVPRFGIARLNADGSFDAGFDPRPGAVGSVNSISIQTDGKILVAGPFSSLDGLPRYGIARLNKDGSLDSSFDPGIVASGSVLEILAQKDNTVFIGGLFRAIDDVSLPGIARLNADGTVDAGFDVSGLTGTVNSIAVQGDGSLLVGGQVRPINEWIPNGIVRLFGGQSARIEPTIHRQPESRTVPEGSTVTLSTGVSGSSASEYQWRFNGNNLAGATSRTLVLSDVTIKDSGSYDLFISDAVGSVTSVTAAVTVFSTLPLADALDSSTLDWTTGGDAIWFGESTDTHDGVDAAESGEFDPRDETWIETTVTGPGFVSFWWMTSDQSFSDELVFSIDEAQAAQIRGTVDWQHQSVSVPEGPRTLRWTYSKGFSSRSGIRKGWLDQVEFSPASTGPPTISTIPNQTIEVGAETDLLPLTVTDAETPASDLTVSVVSSNPKLVPESGLEVGGSGENRTLRVIPVVGQTGSATITITVNDGVLTSSESFELTVRFFPGALDLGFDAPLWKESSVRMMAIQADGKTLIAGPFERVNGELREGIVRLNREELWTKPSIRILGFLGLFPLSRYNRTEDC